VASLAGTIMTIASGGVCREWRVGGLAEPINKPEIRIVSLKVTIDVDANPLQQKGVRGLAQRLLLNRA
jgi:hypothetical protein